MAEPHADPVTAYARDVVEGRAVAGRLVRMACRRHLDDLEEGPARGLRWDLDAARHALDFFGWLRLADGEFAGRPFALQPWQRFIVGSLFGWKGEDGYRRFRTAYLEIGKGNGKTPLAAGVGLYALLADGEAAAEVYSAATAKDQARVLFRDAKNIADASPALKGRLDVGEHNIAHLPSRSFFRPVSSEHKGLDGPRPHVALIDELHEHPTSMVVDKLRKGAKGRRQPLFFQITNAGHDRASVCWQHHQYSLDVLSGKTPNDSWFAYVCGLDPCDEHRAEGKTQPADGCKACDDWRDEKVWPKANPNLGVSVGLKYLREQVAEAEGMPAKEGLTRRLNFCWWSEGETSWLSADLWARGAGPLDREAMRGRVCFGGLDVASKIDVAAFVLAFPDFPEPGQTALLCRFWIPRAQAEARQYADGVPYLLWEREGFLTVTDGDWIDLDAIEGAIEADASAFRIEEVAVDPWNAAQITTHLQQYGLKLTEFVQNLRNFNEPTKSFEAMLKAGQLRHGDNPVLTWMAGNVALITDRSGNVRPVKPAHGSARKVDGIIAAVMALRQSLLKPACAGGGVEFWE